MLKPQKFSENGEATKEVRIPPPCILYRPGSLMIEQEKRAMERHFVTVDSRMLVHGGDLVIGRYSVLPFYKELEEDLRHKGARLINSYREHRYAADLQNYVSDLGDLTFRSWNFRDLPSIPDNIPLVLKGETNSRKDKWNTHMFAKDKRAAVQVFHNLQDDSLIAQQEIYVREYVPLVTLTEGLGGQPITQEYRFFVAYGEIMSGGFYWSSFVDDLPEIPKVSDVPGDFLQEAINKIKPNINFFVMDVAKAQNGKWYVVEVNDGQQAGLSENDPDVLYKNLKDITWNRHKDGHG